MTLEEKEKELLRQYNSTKSFTKKNELVRAIKRLNRIKRLERRKKNEMVKVKSNTN